MQLNGHDVSLRELTWGERNKCLAETQVDVWSMPADERGRADAIEKSCRWALKNVANPKFTDEQIDALPSSCVLEIMLTLQGGRQGTDRPPETTKPISTP